MNRKQNTDRALVHRYTDQPTRLPTQLRHRIEREWGGEPVQLYALSDLSSQLELQQSWLCLGPTRLALLEPARTDTADRAGADARQQLHPAVYSIRHIARSEVAEVHETRGLSSTTLQLLSRPNRRPLATIRYTHRQRLPFENIRFVLNEQSRGRRVGKTDPDAAYASGIAKPIKDAQSAIMGPDRAVIWRLLRYLRPYRHQVLVGMTAAAFITLLSLVPPFLAATLIDDIIEPVQAGTLAVADGARIAWIAVAAMAVVHLLKQACSWIRLRLMSVLGEFVARDLRTELYEHLQSLSLSFFSRKKTGSLITRVSADTDRLWEFLALGIIDVSLAFLVLIGLAIVLIALDWRLGLIMTLPVPFLCWAIVIHGEKLNRLFLGAWRKWSDVTDVLSDTIPGMRVVKAFNQETREIARFDERNHAVTREFNKIHHRWTTFWPGLLLAIHAMTVAVWAFAVPRLLTIGPGEVQSLSAGTFVAFLLYMTMFIAPIEIIGQMARITNRATSSANRVFEVLDTRPEVVDSNEAITLSAIEGHVRFENVTFGYDGIRQVIRGVSFEILPGEMIGLVGPSGGGKSTLTNLLARFYDATGGRILVDGINVADFDSGWYRRQLGMVLQDPYLFFGSVAENIRYGLPSASDAAVVRAAIAANAHDFICRLEHGYDTLLGERGHTLSGGERQRISIARAILRDPKLLILDEATSSVDTETERRIQDALDRLIIGRTVVAIAHRLSTLRRADRILVLKDGEILEQGTHDELLGYAGGTYRRLHEMQKNLAHGV